eukprot:scaffold11904_cov84-Skeletonema_dohrnii-CCMP3373.AAC.3
MSPLDWYKYSVQHCDVIIFFFASALHPIYDAMNSRFLESQMWVLGVTLLFVFKAKSKSRLTDV